MPIYDYHCECGTRFEALQPIAERDQCRCACGLTARREMAACHFHLDPVSGDFWTATRRFIQDRQRANMDDLKALGLRKAGRIQV